VGLTPFKDNVYREGAHAHQRAMPSAAELEAREGETA
jgi:hypothetical protein